MKKVSTSWKNFFQNEGFGTKYFEEFKMRAQNAGAIVHRVKTGTEAKDVIIDIIRSTAAKKVVATPEILSPSSDLEIILSGMEIDLHTEQSEIRIYADTADVGIARVEFGVAETGSVCEDSFAIEQRLITTLPPTSIVIMQSNNVARNLKTAFEVIANIFYQGYISFITGPSRTSDIERVLTIGVHGPSKLIIIAIDEEMKEA